MWSRLWNSDQSNTKLECWGYRGFGGVGVQEGGVTVLLADIFDAVLGVLLEFGVAFDRPVIKTLDASLMNINNILPLCYFDRSLCPLDVLLLQ